jgi:hypothetical protein
MTKKATSKSGPQSGATPEPLLATEAETAKLERSALSRAPFNKAIAKLADKAFATKSSAVKAAYNKAKTSTGRGWKSPGEFKAALYYAVTLKLMEPLAKLLESKTLLTRSDRLAFASFVRSLKPSKDGRPPGPLSDALHVAQRNAVYLVRLGQKAWLIEKNRQRVPASVTDKLIADAIDEASKAFPRSPKLSPGDIRALVNKASRKIID